MLSGEMQVPVWLGLVLLVLAVTGGYAVLCAARDGVAAVWERLRHGRENLSEEDESGCECCDVTGYHYGMDPDECGQCGHPLTWHTGAEDELPPERSWAELTGEQPVLEGVLWEPPGFARDNPRMYAPAGEWLSATGERLMPAWQSEILAARAWWEELPSGTGFTREMAARVRELAP